MAILSILALFCVLFVLAWRTQQKPIEIAPYFICAIGLVLYVLGFFRLLSMIDWILILAGAGAIFYTVQTVRKQGTTQLIQELKRQLIDPYLWGCILMMLVLCVALRGEQFLEWDAYNFWGPDVKSLFFLDGYAPKYSNVSYRFGDYTPGFQLILWWFVHLFGSYQESYVFWGYFIFSGLMLFSVAAVFWDHFPKWRAVTWILIPFLALCIPGVCSVAWYRSIYVDPIMAILFGMLLSKIVHRPERQVGFWKIELLVASSCLVLLKSIGILWSVFGALFFLLWWLKEKREWGFSAAFLAVPLLLSRSWSIYCRVMERSGYLADSFSARALQRIEEVKNGTFFTSQMNRGYINSYTEAFFSTPVHREYTAAVDLAPFYIIVLLVCLVLILWFFGAAPRKKLGSLLFFTIATPLIGYLIVSVGQFTMFFYETQYLDPINAVTLMTRYCEPANTGILMLLLSLAADTAPGAQSRYLPAARRWILSILPVTILLSCTGYRAAYRRFAYDELDSVRVEKRMTYETDYQKFLQDISEVPYWESGSRVLLVVQGSELNPIILNAASPVSVAYVNLSQYGTGPHETILSTLEQSRSGYIYFTNCKDSLLDVLPEGMEFDKLYPVAEFLRNDADSD